MEVIGNQNSFVTNSLQNTFLCSTKESKSWVWVNDDFIIIIIILKKIVNYAFKLFSPF